MTGFIIELDDRQREALSLFDQGTTYTLDVGRRLESGEMTRAETSGPLPVRQIGRQLGWDKDTTRAVLDSLVGILTPIEHRYHQEWSGYFTKTFNSGLTSYEGVTIMDYNVPYAQQALDTGTFEKDLYEDDITLLGEMFHLTRNERKLNLHRAAKRFLPDELLPRLDIEMGEPRKLEPEEMTTAERRAMDILHEDQLDPRNAGKHEYTLYRADPISVPPLDTSPLERLEGLISRTIPTHKPVLNPRDGWFIPPHRRGLIESVLPITEMDRPKWC